MSTHHPLRCAALIVLVGCGEVASVEHGPRLWVVAGGDQRGEVGTTLAQPVVVELETGTGAPIVGQRLVVTTTHGGSPPEAVTDREGRARFTWTLGTYAAAQTLFATANDIEGRPRVSVIAHADAGPATTLYRVPSARAVALPNTGLDPVSVIAHDRFGNTVPHLPLRWSVEQGAGALLVQDEQTDLNGIARATWRLGPDPGLSLLAVGAAAVTTQFEAIATHPLEASLVSTGMSHTCGLNTDGTAFCWGRSVVVPFENASSLSAVRVPISAPLVSLTSGGNASCGLTAAGVAWCWGDVPGLGRTEPVALSAGPFQQVVLGDAHACGLDGEGRASCWGQNISGQLGTSLDGDASRPVSVRGNLTFTRLVASAFHSCGLTPERELWCWGSNQNMQLGPDARDECLDGWYYYYSWCARSPVRVRTQVTHASLGLDFTCVTSGQGDLSCLGFDRSDAFALPGSAGVTSVVRWQDRLCGLGADGGVVCWLRGPGGQVGGPQRITSEPLTSLAGGSEHLCGVSAASARVLCVGRNTTGQLGDGTTAYRSQFGPVARPPDF